ncbi:MAG: NAD-dependent epimerase/dehydratase family protein [Acidobacteriota bacterium]
MSETILVTGGAGFIGSHLVDKLVADGHRVRVLDALDPQVHEGGQRPDYLNPQVDYTFASMSDDAALAACLEGVDVVVHFAASVGVGQSMYAIEKYVESNTLGTSKLLDRLVNQGRGQIRKLVVASSMSVYGEGLYDCATCGLQAPGDRSIEQLEAGQWEPRCPSCGEALAPRPTDESKPLDPTSVYALTKYDQERLCVAIGKAYKLPVVALRFFNVYGPRQALSNPYTGVAAIFSSRIKAGNAPLVYEDGQQRRDFVSVYDIVAAVQLVMEHAGADYRVFNVGSGHTVSVVELAELLIELYGKQGELQPEIAGRFRQGDIRHCFADISALRDLGFAPAIELADGLRDLAAWADGQQAEDRFQAAQQELRNKGLA